MRAALAVSYSYKQEQQQRNNGNDNNDNDDNVSAMLVKAGYNECSALEPPGYGEALYQCRDDARLHLLYPIRPVGRWRRLMMVVATHTRYLPFALALPLGRCGSAAPSEEEQSRQAGWDCTVRSGIRSRTSAGELQTRH